MPTRHLAFNIANAAKLCAWLSEDPAHLANLQQALGRMLLYRLLDESARERQDHVWMLLASDGEITAGYSAAIPLPRGSEHDEPFSGSHWNQADYASDALSKLFDEPERPRFVLGGIPHGSAPYSFHS